MAETIDLDEARRRILARVVPTDGQERVPLLESLGRRLADDLVCGEPWPTTDRSAMDGFALRAGTAEAGAGSRFRVVGEALAGHPFERSLADGEAVRIMTGGVVPAGADRVAKVEDTSGFAGGTVELRAAVRRGENIRPLGSEIAAGTVVLRAGARIRAAEIGVLAVLGRADVSVVLRPRVAILSTGDEVVDVAADVQPHQVRDSNSWAIAAKVLEAGGAPERLGVAGDDAASLRGALERGLTADVLVTIGGVSKGTHDLVHVGLNELGVAPVFHGIALKPGKPAWFGVREHGGRTCHVFGLPGNPASAFTTFDLLVLPLLERWSGGAAAQELTLRLGGVAPRRNRRTQAVPARLTTDGDGQAVAELGAVRPSGDPFSLLGGDGYAIVPADVEPDSLRVVRYVDYAGGPRSARGGNASG